MSFRKLRKFESLGNRLCLFVSVAVGDGDNSFELTGGTASGLNYHGGDGIDSVALADTAAIVDAFFARLGDGVNSVTHAGAVEGDFSVVSFNEDVVVDITDAAVKGQCIMRTLLLTISLALMTAQTAQAGHLGLGGPGDLGLGGHHGEFGRGGGFGRGHGFGGGLNAEAIQTRFETKFADLQTEYDTGLADIEDFYSSEEYTGVVDGVETLSDRYDWFLTGVERTIERLGDYISMATEELTFYDELLAKYEANEDISEERLERRTTRITDIQDTLTIKIDYLTEKQTTLSDNFGSYQTFGDGLATYLADIVAAGGGTTDTDDTATALALLSDSPLRALASTTAGEEMSFCDVPQGPVEASAAPEPNTFLTCMTALGLMAARRPRRRPPA